MTVSCKSKGVLKECQVRVSHKVKCQVRMSSQNVPRKCGAIVPSRCAK